MTAKLMRNLTFSTFVAMTLGMTSVVSAQEAVSVQPAQAADVNAAPACVSNKSGAMVNDLAANAGLNSSIASLGGIRGLLYTWDYESKGTVRFYQSSSGRLMLSYDYGFFGSGTAKMTKVCRISSSTLKLIGNVDGDPFVMFVKGVGQARSVEFGDEKGEFRRFYR